MRGRFRDRRHAGRILAQSMRKYRGVADTIVLGLPRGGVPVAYEVARELRAPLDIFLVRKLGLPGHEEYAMGAIASGEVRVLNLPVLRLAREGALEEAVARERAELARRERLYRGLRSLPRLSGACTLLIDDGLATGASMRAAVQALRKHRPARIVVGVPVASPETCELLGEEVDEIVCTTTPESFSSVGAWYRDFTQTTDEEVQALLAHDVRGFRRSADG
jgi:putative phosphoribosyl transferase